MGGELTLGGQPMKGSTRLKKRGIQRVFWTGDDQMLFQSEKRRLGVRGKTSRGRTKTLNRSTKASTGGSSRQRRAGER